MTGDVGCQRRETVRNGVGDGAIEPHDVVVARLDLCALGMVRGQMMRFEMAVGDYPSMVFGRGPVSVRRRERGSRHPKRYDDRRSNRGEQSTSHAAIIVAR